MKLEIGSQMKYASENYNNILEFRDKKIEANVQIENQKISMAGVRNKPSNVRSKKSEVRSLKSEVRGRDMRSEERSRKLEV